MVILVVTSLRIKMGLRVLYNKKNKKFARIRYQFTLIVMNAKAQKEMAECFRIRLMTDLCNVAEVIAWSDKIISDQDEPDIEIIEVSTCSVRKINEIISMLEKVQGECDYWLVVRKVFGLMLNMLEKDTDLAYQIAQGLYTICMEYGQYLPWEVESEIHGIDYNFELAIDNKFCSLEEAQERLKNFLQRYQWISV